MARSRQKPGRWFAFAAVLLICAGFVLPFLWMLSTSLKTVDRTMAFPPDIFPHPAVPQNYWNVIKWGKRNYPQ